MPHNSPSVRRHVSILVAVCALTFFAGLGRGAINDSDEAFYAQAAREMVESGDWLTPSYNYEPRFQKPILYYWLAGAAFEAFGVSEWAARLPSALSGLGLVLLTHVCARRWLAPRVALVAGLIVATNFGYFVMARQSLPDLPLAFFITLASWPAIEALGTGRQEADASHTQRWLLLASVGAALAFLTKGPVGVALPGLVAIAYWALGPRMHPSRRLTLPGRPRDWAMAALAFVAIAAPWYVAMVGEHGLGYLHRFFVAENVERFATDRYNEPRSVFFYVPIVLGGLLPWSPFMAPWFDTLRRILTRRRQLTQTEWALILWAAVPLVFYSFSIGKQPRYVLPSLPPLAILLAASLQRWTVDVEDGQRPRAPLVACTVATGIAVGAIGLSLYRTRILLVSTPPALVAALALLIVALAALLIGVAWRGRPSWLPATLAGVSAAVLLALHYAVFSAPGTDAVQVMAARARADAGAVAASGTHDVFVRNFVFYTRRKQVDLADLAETAAFLRSAERVHCVVGARDLKRLEDQYGVKPVRLAEVPYFNPTGLRIGSVLKPDPNDDIDVAVLVANR